MIKIKIYIGGQILQIINFKVMVLPWQFVNKSLGNTEKKINPICEQILSCENPLPYFFLHVPWQQKKENYLAEKHLCNKKS
jgi:hypothetical protein